MKNQEEINQLKDEREILIKEETRLIPIIKTIKDDILKKKTINDNDPLFLELDKLQERIGIVRDEVRTIDSKISWLEIK